MTGNNSEIHSDEMSRLDAAFTAAILVNPELAATIYNTVLHAPRLRERWASLYPNATNAAMFMQGYVRVA